MKYISYYIFKLCAIIFVAIALVSYFYQKNMILDILSCGAMNTIAFESIIQANKQKINIEIKSMVQNEGYYKPVNIIPIYILSFMFFFLGFLQLMQLVHFDNANNLIISLLIDFYLIYRNEKIHKTSLEYEKSKQEYINKYGKETFIKMNKASNELLKKFEDEFKDIYNKK